jgi:hypothetical protein
MAPLILYKSALPGHAETLRNNLRSAKQEVGKAVRAAGEFFEDWKNGVEILKGISRDWWEGYKEDLAAIGINNIGDFAKWTLKCIGATAGVVFGGLAVKFVLGAGLLGGVGSFAMSTLGFMSAITLQPIVTPLLQSGIQLGGAVLNFNINQTDQELWKQLEAKVNGMYGLLGTTVGSALGWLVCGALPNSVMFRFNKAVAVAVAQDLNEEAKSELYSQIGQIIRLSQQTLINSELINRYTSLRRELKNNPNSDFSKYLRSVIGEETFKKWGKENQQPWTIKKNIVDKAIDSEKDPNWKSFYENTLEGFTESCIEASMLVANNLDTYIASQKIARSNLLGRVQTVRIRLGESVTSRFTPA